MSERKLPPLVLRADGGATQGTGHLMRARGLGMAWRERGGSVHLVSASRTPALLQLMHDSGFAVVRTRAPHPDRADVHRLLTVLETLVNPWVVLDGYQFDEGYVATLQDAGHRVLHLDDMAHLSRYTAEIVVNQNAHAAQTRYRSAPGTRLLCGTSYVILRPEFRHRRRRGRTPRVARRVLITFGGADPHRLTEQAIEAMSKVQAVPAPTVTVVLGSANQRGSRIFRSASQIGSFRLVRAADNMAELMADADLAVASAGTTVWELAYMGVPALLIESGPAERLLLEGLQRIGLFENIGRAGSVNAESIAAAVAARLPDVGWRRQTRKMARATVDGRGVDRIVSLMLDGHR